MHRVALLVLLAAGPAVAQRVPSARLSAGEQACQTALDLSAPDDIRTAAARIRVDAARTGDARAAVCAQYADAYARSRLGEPGTERLFGAAAQAAARAGDVWTQAAAVARQGYGAGQNGAAEPGVARIREALALADAAGGPGGREARLVPLNLLAHLLLDMGRPDESAETFATLEREARAVGSHRFAGIGAVGQGTVAFDGGDLVAAVEHLRRSQAEADAEGDAPWHSGLLATRARLDAATGRLDEAAALLRQLVDAEVAAGKPVESAMLLEQLGGVYRQNPARRGAAVVAYRKAHDLLVGTDLSRERHKFRLLEAAVLYDAGRADEARRVARPAADSVAAAPLDRAEEGLAFLMLARDARLAGRPADAVAFARRSVAAAEASGIQGALVDGTAELALALDAAGDATGALAAYRRSVALDEEIRSLDQARAVGQQDAAGAFDAERADAAARRRRLLWGLGALVAAGALAAAATGAYVRAMRRKNAEIARQAADLARAGAARTRFLANVSHELRTPLTLLLGPLDDLRSGRFAVAPEARPLLDRAAVNGHRLRRLIDDLLALARLDADALALRRERLDLAAFARDRVAAFGSAADSAGVDLAFEGTPAPVAFDPAQVETAVYNVVANAVKFTPAGGRVRVRVAPADGGAVVVVADSGAGVSPADLPHLFERFYQGDTAQAHSGEGTGLGLALAREIVLLHGGTITAESTLGAGTTVRIWLPAGTPDVPAADVPAADVPAADVPAAGSRGTASLVEARLSGDGRSGDALPVPGNANDDADDTDDDRPLVLVVEDNADLRAYLRAILGPTYRLDEAPDGAAGIARAVETVPDLVLSDVMMPGTDGFALLAALKADVRTSHIPVVLLTARADAESRLAGLSAGADDYVAKPFSAAEVEARVANLIAGRRALRERWSRRDALDPPPADAPSQEVAFLDRLRASAEARLGDVAFGVDALADALAMSPRQLARKLRALTDETPGAYVRRLRLTRAADLLRTGRGVAEVTEAVGFASRSQFSTAFREAYGVAPSAFALAPDEAPAGDEPPADTAEGDGGT